MNFIHIAPDLKWAKIFILPLAEKQSNEGNKVYLSAPSNASNDENNTPVETLNLIGKLKNPKSHFFGICRLIHTIKTKSISRVYFHTSIDSFLPMIFIRLFTNSEVVYVNHGVPYDGYNNLLRIAFKIIELSNIVCSHRVISITKSMTSLLQKVNFFHKSIDTLEPGTISGISLKFNNYSSLLETRQRIASKIDKDILRIIYVARIEARKGIYELVEAVSNYQTKDIHLSILGNGRENLSDVSFDKDIVSIEGYIDDLTDFYLNADILIVPSYHEGFGQVYLEAASLGVIPVCSNIIGPTDFIINEYNGFTVTPKSTQAITNLLNEILSGKYDLDQIRLNAFNSAKRFDSRIVLQNNIKVFNK